MDEPESILSAIKAPDQYRLDVQNLCVAAPPPRWEVPMALTIRVPRAVQRRLQKDAVLPKRLVGGVNLRVEPGELAALVGGSGSGKTTLLTAIALRLGDLLSEGSVTFTPLKPRKGKSGSQTSFRKIIGYVRQDDESLLPYLTVRETLTFSAALRLPTTVDRATREAIVEETLLELGLRDVADVIVGSTMRRGISGGEKRRLSIGCSLVTLPSVLVLDEPTTGLDAWTSYAILETLQKIARRGRVVVLSIHQPRSDLFPLLDNVTLLSQGSVVYSGPTRAMLPHFDSLGYKPAEHVNPLDFVVDISSVDTRDDAAEATSSARVGELVLAWRQKENAAGRDAIWNKSTAGGLTTAGQLDAEKAQLGLRPTYSRKGSTLAEDDTPQRRPNALVQAHLLVVRGLKNVTRNYGQTLGLFLQSVIIGVGLGLAFLTPPETPAGIQSLKTVIYMSTPAFFYLSIIVYCYILCSELRVFDREREDNLYQTVPAVIGLVFSHLPAAIIFPTLYAVIVYFMTGFWRQDLAVNVFSFIAQCIMQQLCAFAYALLGCGVNRSFAQASLLLNGFSIIFVLTSGYLITDLPVWISWARWLSPYFYGYNWIARLQFIGRQFACVGVTGPGRNACDGINNLIGLRFQLTTPLYVYPLGMLGFIIVTLSLATLLLAFYKPGGVKHAVIQTSSTPSSKQAEPVGLSEREGVDVVVDRLGLNVSLRSLSTKTKGKAVERAILTDVTARFPRGQVSVIMGPSGAGKSSLLQVLGGRLSSGPMSRFSTHGEVRLNGEQLGSSHASLVAFVEQEDAHHLPALTVRETLRYAARLRLRGHTTKQCDARAEELLRMLGLKPCAYSLVGNSLMKGISGGEKRRLSLAVELVSDPAVLLADEPLSGLDAFTARNVMQLLSDLAASGRTVIVSVHQPRSDIWEMFDNVLLLAKGGVTAYSGPRSDILKTFEEGGAICPPNFNPADFILDAISVDIRSNAAEEKTGQQVGRLLSLWKERQASSQASTTSSMSDSLGTGQELKAAPFYRAFPVIINRSSKNLIRQKDAFVARLVNPPFLALLFFLFFARLGYGPSSAQDRVGLLQETTALPFIGMLSCLAIFPGEKALFLHEWKTSGRQSVTAFLLSYTVQETVSSVSAALLWSVVFVFGMNLQWSARIFFEFWFSSFALLSFGESIGIMFSSFFESGGLAVSLTSAGITLLSQLNGIISVTLPYWLEIIGWISPMKPQCRIQIINEMRGLEFECTEDQVASGACIATTGEQLLATFSISPEGTGKFIGILMALVVIWRLFAFAALRAKTVVH